MAVNESGDFREELLALKDDYPFMEHPWFQEVKHGVFTGDQIIAGEEQHYLRIRRNADIFGPIINSASNECDYTTLRIARLNYGDEMCGERSHADIMYQFLEEQGIDRIDADNIEPTPGTMAAIGMLTSASSTFTAIEQMAMMSLPELQYGGKDGVAAMMYETLTQTGRFSKRAVETFSVHAEADEVHGPRQIDHLVRRVEQQPHMRDKILRAARHGVIAFNNEWDGHYQAARDEDHYHWEGLQPLNS